MINESALRALRLLLLISICAASGNAFAGKEGTFTGAWIASGEFQPMDFVEGREVFTFRIAGHMNLSSEIEKIADFWSECTGLWDAETGCDARCVWRTVEGEDAAFSVLTGRLVEKDVQMNGQFVGGAGKLKGLTGQVSFTWQSVFRNQTEKRLTGHSQDIAGSYKLP